MLSSLSENDCCIDSTGRSVSSSFSGFPPTVSGELRSVVHPCVERSQVFFNASSPEGSTAGLHLQKLLESSIHQNQTMRSGVVLCLLGLLCLHSSVFGQETVEVQPGVLIFCDDPSVEKAVNSAVHKFNERLTTGHKLALFQILTASKSENGSDSVYSLQFTSRRSDCPAGSNKPWTDCNYLPMRIISYSPVSCNATVYMTETEADTRQVDCQLNDHIVPEKASCLGCPVEIDDNSEDLRSPLSVSIAKYNSVSDSTHLFTLHSISHATRQVVAGFRFKLRFDMRKTTCAKDEHKDLNELCVPDENNVEFANCNSTVDIAPWRLEPPEAQMECAPGALPEMFTRRRPPGWSPLRNLLYDVASTTKSTPTKAAAKEESSEEDSTTTKASASPDVASDAVNDSPFHCPSKPWKPFNPNHLDTPDAPTMATVEAASPQPSADGAFSDVDLLG
ncbi:kininogen-1 isoform X2 [Dicentrarchus labrax]|uniref:kininogen-1 isoform X2 n=1 Tax=Dicentrarchus labrax TaxID=13489 RepID=UPI0021F61D17|nr:kininogen-1 isoform X2 [Dicentrarchus labrax]